MIEYNIEYKVCPGGLLLRSKLGTDLPIIILNNQYIKLFISHGNQTINHLSTLPDLKVDELNFSNMITYCCEINGKSYWLIAIPYTDLNLDPSNYMKFDEKPICHKKFTSEDFPSSFSSFKNLAIITGIPE